MIRGLACLLALTATTTAWADDLHYEDLRFGQTAIGMGGAVTGFMTEPEATFYNPAGIAFLSATAFAGSLTFTGLDRRILRKGITLNEIDTPELDARSNDFVALPSSSAIVYSFGGSRHAVGFSSYLVSDTRETFDGTLDFAFDDIFERVTLASSTEDRTLLMGPSYAFRFDDRFALGLSVFYARRDQKATAQFSQRTAPAEFPDDPDELFEVIERFKSNDGALLARIGAMWRPSKRWSLGAVVGTQSIHIHGKGTLSFRFINATTNPDPFEDDAFFEFQVGRKVSTEYPWVLGLGASFHEEGKWRLAVSGNLYLPTSSTRIDLSDFDEGVASVSSEVTRELTVNGALGAELYLTPRWPLRAGIFTNLSSAPSIDAPVVAKPAITDINLFGASMSIGYIDDDATLNFGVETQLGRGHATVFGLPEEEDADPVYLRREREQIRVLFFVSGAMAFAKTKAKKLIETDDDTDDAADIAPEPPLGHNPSAQD